MTLPKPRLTARVIESHLMRQGFELVAERRGHRKWRHPALRLQIVVPEHGGRELPEWFTNQF